MEHMQRSTRCLEYNATCPCCQKQFKGDKGLSSHLERGVCSQAKTELNSNHCIPQGSESGSLTNQESHHSVGSRQDKNADRRKLQQMEDLKPIKWPAMNDTEKWNEFERLICGQLQDNWDAFKKVRMLEKVVYCEALRIFGAVERKQGKVRETNSRRRNRSCTLRKRKNDIERAMKSCNDESERAGLEEVMEEIRIETRKVRKAENSRKRRWRRKKAKEKFYKNPFDAGKELLDPRTKMELKTSREELNNLLNEMAYDPDRDVPLGELVGLNDTHEPQTPFAEGKFSLITFGKVVKSRRNASRPGLNMLPYKVYKKCPVLQKYLFKIVQACRTAKKIPLTWRIANIIFIPKGGVDEGNIFKVRGKEVISSVGESRPIALSNVEGKLWWAMVAQRFYDYLITDNKYIDIAIQKGSIKSMSGCWEHTSMSWSALKDARQHKKSLVLIWLDLANAYGSVPHQLIFHALRRYHVPIAWIRLVEMYYDGLWGRLTVDKIVSNWELFEKGIFAGCTLSVILFLAAINVIIEYVSLGRLPRYQLTNGPTLSTIRGFMDDLALALKSVPAAKIALGRVIKALKWSRMRPKPPKSRSLVMIKGRAMDVQPFVVDSIEIPSVQRKPVKSLGRVFDSSVSDRKAKDQLEKKVREAIMIIDKSDYTGYMKLWILNNVLVLRIKWQLTVYEIPMSYVENMEIIINKYSRKWLGVSKILSETALYGKQVPCPLPLTSLRTIFKVSKASALMQLRHSRDMAVAGNKWSLKTGRKWKVKDAVERAKSRIRLMELTESGQSTKAGLGLNPKERVPLEGSGEYRKLVAKMVKREDDEKLYIKSIQQGIQGRWTQWRDYIQRDLRWKNLLAGPPALTSFCMGATYGTLAAPSNLKRWGLSKDGRCELCEKDGAGIQHILSNCNIALGQGRYRYRHNEVLRGLAQFIQKQVNFCKSTGKRSNQVRFVKAGEKVKTKKRVATGILQEGSNWKVLVDLDKALVFPIVVTLQRPDMVLVAEKEKIVVIIELTCPVEENFEERHREKMERYEELVAECKGKGWITHLFAVEVGARGYTARSLWNCWRRLGVAVKDIKTSVQEASDISLRCSFWIWLSRKSIYWTGRGDMQDSVLNAISEEQPVERVSTAEPVIEPQAKERKHSSQRHLMSQQSKSPHQRPLQSNGQEALGQKAEGPMTLVGVRNLGNSCYLSAVLQCLRVIDVRDWQKINKKVMETSVRSSTVWEEYFRAQDSMRIGRKSVFSPTGLCRAIGRTFPSFNVTVQQDAHEFLLMMLESMNRESRKWGGGGWEVACTGQLSSTVKCGSCENVSVSYDDCHVLSLEIPGGRQKLSVVDCWEEFCKEECMTNQDGWECKECNRGSFARKKIRLFKEPSLLILHLKRFVNANSRLQKIRESIVIPRRIEQTTTNYQLCGLVHHHGQTLSNGHYTAELEFEGEWFRCDDESIAVTTRTMDRGSRDAYLLFYKICEEAVQVAQ